MPKKLVLNRALSMRLAGNSVVTVPNDEVWKASVFNIGAINGTGSIAETELLNYSFGGGAAIKIDGGGGAPGAISGVAYKVQEV